MPGEAPPARPVPVPRRSHRPAAFPAARPCSSSSAAPWRPPSHPAAPPLSTPPTTTPCQPRHRGRRSWRSLSAPTGTYPEEREDTERPGARHAGPAVAGPGPWRVVDDVPTGGDREAEYPRMGALGASLRAGSTPRDRPLEGPGPRGGPGRRSQPTDSRIGVSARSAEATEGLTPIPTRAERPLRCAKRGGPGLGAPGHRLVERSFGLTARSTRGRCPTRHAAAC